VEPTDNSPRPSADAAPFRRRRLNLVGAATVTLALVVVVGLAAYAGSSASPRERTSGAPATVTVTGTGSVQGAPDTISFSLGVHTTAATATDAFARNNAQMAALVRTLRHDGRPASDLATSNLNLYMTYNNSGTATGFAVDDTLTVTTHRVGAAGRIIDDAVRATGPGIEMSGVTLSISDQSALMDRARAKAMAHARHAADQLARAGGRSLGAVVRITDQGSSNPIVYPLTFSASSAGRAVPIQSGRQTLSDQVSVVYALS
jgi:uncharacterized protein YggE